MAANNRSPLKSDLTIQCFVISLKQNMEVARFILDKHNQVCRSRSLSSFWPLLLVATCLQHFLIYWPKLCHMQNHRSISGKGNGISQTGLVPPLLNPSAGYTGNLSEVNGC